MLSRLRRRRAHPRLSLVVPVYNVEPYLAECLDSILAQTYDDLEVLLVDDGSTDGSVRIAEGYVRGHDRIRMIHQVNAGLSAARNTGVRHVDGELLAFVDSDDVVPPDAYETMVGALDESGSDFVVGSVLKGVPGAAEVPSWLRPIHRDRRLGIRPEDHPTVIHDIFAWNKVFRRAFWDRQELSFPEGVRYEDQVAITRAFLLAERIDVLVRPVYLWRERTDGSSITQRRHELRDLEDRVATKLMASEVVEALASPPLREQWRLQGLPGDLPLYFHHLPDCADDYWDTLHRGLRAMCDLEEIPRWRIPTQQRLTGWLVHEARRSEASAVIEHLRDHPRGLALDVRGDHVVALLPGVDDPTRGVPPELYRLAAHELVFDAQVTAAGLRDGQVVVDGWALIRGAPPADLPTGLEASWRRADGVEVAASVTQWRSEDANDWVGREHQDYRHSGFTAAVDASRLVAAPATEPVSPPASEAVGPSASVPGRPQAPSGGERGTLWTLHLRRHVAQVAAEGPVRSRHHLAGAPAPLTGGTVGEYPVEMEFRPAAGGLRVVVLPPSSESS